MTVAERRDLLVSTYKISPFYADRIVSELANAEFTEDNIQAYIKAKPKPFVKWVGGKRQLLKQFKELGIYPPKGFDAHKNTYHEPFVGGGAMFFDLLPYSAELSDMNYELVTTYNTIRDNVENLIGELVSDKYTYDKEVFLKIRATQPSELSELETAARFIYLNRTAFNGMYRVNGKGGFNVPFGRYTNPLICDTDNLRSVATSLKKVQIQHRDYKAILDNAKSGDFVYFDPPYHPVSETASFTAYTADGFTGENQVELRDTFLELHKRRCFVMLSNSDTELINSIYEELESESIVINKVSAGRAINSNAAKRGKVQEVLITNYTSI
jgi:DNA adenine methylase